MKNFTVKEFFEEKRKDFTLSVITSSSTLNNKITDPQLNRPGLALAGYLDRFSYNRVQILGETEITYMQSLQDKELYNRLKEMFEYSIPCIIVTKGLSVPHQMEYLANEMNIAILISRLSTEKLFNGLNRYFRAYFAPRKSIHGTLVDVFGAGVLITGSSGIGKSECALDLVERGHRLIVDDLVQIVQSDDMLFGSSAKKNMGWFMEIRGVGIVDIERMFGIQAVRREKKLSIQIELMPWRDNMDYERIGLKNNYVSYHGINIPVIYLPVSPGKNVSVIIEVVAMNQMLKSFGYDAAEAYVRRLQNEIKKKTLDKKGI